MMKALVLGGNGFIGTHLVDQLVREGHEVCVFDRQSELYRKPLDFVEYYLGDFGNRGALSHAIKDVDIVFHLVSTTVPKSSNEDPAFDVKSNVVETIFLLEQCVEKKVKKVVFVSSGGAVYGRLAAMPVAEDDPKEPVSSYGITKLMIEKYITLYSHLYGLKYAIIRPSNPYGERQNPNGGQGVIAAFLGKTANSQPIEIWGNGEAIKDYIYIGDLIAGIYKAALFGTQNRIFNLGSGVGHSINDIIELMARNVDMPISVNHSGEGTFDVPRIYLDISRARKELQWEPVVPLDEGIRRTWEFIKNEMRNRELNQPVSNNKQPRHMLARQVLRRFGSDVAEQSEPLLSRIADPQRLDDLAEVLLESPDVASWLRALRVAAGGPSEA